MANIREVFEELNYPSAGLLRQVLKRRDIPFTNAEVDALVKGETVRQVQAPAPLLQGKIASKHLNAVWFADLIDLTAAPSVGKRIALEPTDEGDKYILVVQDVFSRRIFARALRDKRPSTVLAAFKEILAASGESCKELVVDRGGEFLGPFKAYIESVGIKFKTKGSMRHIATLDVAIGNLKKAMVRDARKAKTDDWADRLDKVVRGQNQLPRDYLEGAAPASVPDNVELIQMLTNKNEDFTKHNRDEVNKRENTLREAGHFRVLLNRPQNFVRGFKPKWSEDVHRVDSIDFDTVIDQDGRSYKTKFVLPVSDYTESAPIRMEKKGSEQTESKRKRILGEIADMVAERFGAGNIVSLARVGRYLNSLGYFRAKALEAGLNMRSPIANFLRVFPSLFTVNLTGPQAVVRIRPPLLPGRLRLRRAVVEELV